MVCAVGGSRACIFRPFVPSLNIAFMRRSLCGWRHLSVGILWAVFLVVNGVVLGNGHMRGVLEKLGRDM